jgi:hypothetical protein
MNLDDIDGSALKAVFASKDEAAIHREWDPWIAKVEAKAAREPEFGKWFEEFRADQERLLRWDDVLEDAD